MSTPLVSESPLRTSPDTIAVRGRERAFNARTHEVRAILAGRQTQFRRVMVPQPDASLNHYRREIDRFRCVGTDVASGRRVFEAGNFAGPIYAFRDGRDSVKADIACPYGQPGDRLWVRETWAAEEAGAGDCDFGFSWLHYRATPRFGIRTGDRAHVTYLHESRTEAEVEDHVAAIRWKPSIHMPRWASRITLEITDVRVERVQEISEADAKAEGVEESWSVMGYHAEHRCWHPLAAGHPVHGVGAQCIRGQRAQFASLWDDINAKRGYGWDANPWVWAISFRPLSALSASDHPPETTE